jgi:hypothetical protein
MCSLGLSEIKVVCLLDEKAARADLHYKQKILLLLSRAKLVKTDHRKTMTAAHLDAMLFLQYNKSRWNAETIQRLLDEKKPSVIELEGEEEVQEDA